VVESVYSAVRTDSLYKADYVWSSKRLIMCFLHACRVGMLVHLILRSDFSNSLLSPFVVVELVERLFLKVPG